MAITLVDLAFITDGVTRQFSLEYREEYLYKGFRHRTFIKHKSEHNTKEKTHGQQEPCFG